MSGLRNAGALAAVAATFALVASAASAGNTAAPSTGIRGLWLGFVGVVQVTGSTTKPVGRLVANTAGIRCPHTMMEKVWQLSGSGTHYSGTETTWDSRTSKCRRVTAQATWTLKGNRLTVHDVSQGVSGTTIYARVT